MRSSLALVICIAFLAPSLGWAQSLTADEVAAFQSAAAHPAECARLRRQVDHYLGMQQRAVTLNDEMWQGRLGHHVTNLRAMQAVRCPNGLPVDTTAEAFKALIQIAAKAALTYFTFGAF